MDIRSTNSCPIRNWGKGRSPHGHASLAINLSIPFFTNSTHELSIAKELHITIALVYKKILK